MKLIFSVALLALAPAFVLAQDLPKKPVKATAKAPHKTTSSRIQLKTAAKNVAAGI